MNLKSGQKKAFLKKVRIGGKLILFIKKTKGCYILGVEMYYFSLQKAKDGLISGMFKLINYGNLLIRYELKGERVLFHLSYRLNEKVEEQYKKWYEKERNIYEDFIFVYVEELNKLNTINLPHGKIVHEVSFKDSEYESSIYEISVKFDTLLKDTKFSFVPERHLYGVETNLHFPINSQGITNSVKIRLKEFMSEDAIKRMWEPFRHQTKYRLQLLHILR